MKSCMAFLPRFPKNKVIFVWETRQKYFRLHLKKSTLKHFSLTINSLKNVTDYLHVIMRMVLINL